MNNQFVQTAVACLFCLVIAPAILAAQTADVQDIPSLESQLGLAGENRPELEKAIQSATAEQKPAVTFLIANMPVDDLQSLSSEFLLTNVRQALAARESAAWQIPDDIFFNDVLPYANIDETRESWRDEMARLCQPIVADCKSPGEAAQRLNEQLFKKVGVKYSTKRKKANQSPSESMEQGLASCTGLSILLTDACRSVGVPARLAGIPSWKNKRGNHTWVEVWDDQKWNFTGAAEPSDKGLNHTWFQGDAALADPESKMHSIYAVSFRKTPFAFPMVWSPGKRVFAENVTKRYIPAGKAESSTASSTGLINVMVRVWNQDKTQRVVHDIKIVGSEEDEQTGQSRGNEADMNDMLTFKLKPESSYRLHVLADNVEFFELETGKKDNQLFEISVGAGQEPVTASTLEKSQETEIVKIANAYFGSGVSLPEKEIEALFESDTVKEAILTQPESVRKLVWQTYLKSPLAQSLKSDFGNKQVTFEESSSKVHLSPYTIKEVGTRPENGWPLFIAMHGGGGAPARVNDSQWKHMQIYYKDQEQLTGYKYLALRAPNNTWNGFYDDYVYPLIENLIKQFLVFGDVDPNKVFIMGYSHGGYGAFSIGPKIPYRFAAIHASAAAPTDGQTSAKTLRNTRFTFMVGEKDTAYGRRERCEKFAKKIDELKATYEGEYPVEFLYKEGFGHGGLPDRDMISQMYEHQRNVTPANLTWEMTDGVCDRFFWLAIDQPVKGKTIEVTLDDNELMCESDGAGPLVAYLDQRLIDPKQPVLVTNGTDKTKVDYVPSVNVLCETLADSGDINLAFDFKIEIK